MTNLFNNINNRNREKLLRKFEAMTFDFKKNTSILKTLKNENIIGIVVSGYIQIIKTDYNGNRTIIEELEDNNVFSSKLSSLSNSEYEIIVKEDSRVIIIDYDMIIDNDYNYPSYNIFIKNLLQIITNITTDKNERIEILTKKTIRDKLLEYFKILSTKHGSKYIYLPFSFTDLADYLAVDRSAMSRELKHLKEEGFIEVKSKRITLLYR